MKKMLLFAILFIPLAAQAALPPAAQNSTDLRELVAFVEQHRKVVETLKLIDFQNYTIHFGEDCRAVFGRDKPKSNAPGPAPRLVFQHTNCELD